MKSKFMGLAKVALIISGMFSGMTHAVDVKCDIKVFQQDTTNWREFFSGMLLGLHSGSGVNRDNCVECASFGVQLGRINTGLVGVEATR